MVEILSKELGAHKNILMSLLSQIEKNLPLNQMYVDLTNDERLENDKAQDKDELEQALRNMLSDSLSPEEKIAFLERMSSIPPYSNNETLIEKLKMEVEADA